jgi:DNA topoisomerase-2
VPWAAGFRGVIEMGADGRRAPSKEDARDDDGGASGAVPRPLRFVSRGVAELTAEGVVVSELPLGEWTSSYKEWLQQRMADESACWTSFSERHTETHVCFAFRHSAQQLRELRAADALPLHSIFELEAKHSLQNVHAFDADGELRHFDAPEQLIALHADARLRLYARRKAHQLATLGAELDAAQAKARFIAMALRGELPLFERAPRDQVVAALRAADFAPHPPTAPRVHAAATHAAAFAGVLAAGDGAADDLAIDAGGGRGRAEFGHLLSMPIISLTAERVVALEKQVGQKQREVAELSGTTELQLWTRELEALRAPLEAYVRERAEGAGEPAHAHDGRPTTTAKRKARAAPAKAKTVKPEAAAKPKAAGAAKAKKAKGSK